MEFQEFLILQGAISIGFIAGFLSVKINYWLIIKTGKLFISGSGWKKHVVIGFILAVLFFNLFAYVLKPFDWFFAFLFADLVLVCFTFGVYFTTRRLSERSFILHRIINAMFTNSLEGNEKTDDAFAIANQILDDMPPANKEAILFAVLFFDSKITVFFVSLLSGHYLSSKRFIDMSPAEQDMYLKTASKDPNFAGLVAILKSISSLAYLTSKLTWDDIGYNGKVLKRSILN